MGCHSQAERQRPVGMAALQHEQSSGVRRRGWRPGFERGRPRRHGFRERVQLDVQRELCGASDVHRGQLLRLHAIEFGSQSGAAIREDRSESRTAGNQRQAIWRGGWPTFTVTNYGDLGTPGGSSALRYADTQYEYTANASWIKSAHTIRFGVDISKYSLNHYEATSAMGVFNFTGNVTTLRGGPSANQYNSFAQMLLGLTSSVVSELLPFDDNRITSRQKSYSFYAQDSGRRVGV